MGPLVPHWSVTQWGVTSIIFSGDTLQPRGEGCGAADPFLIAIVVDAHHESAPEADEGDGRLEGAAVGPEVHDADLCLGEAVWGLDGGLEGDSLL